MDDSSHGTNSHGTREQGLVAFVIRVHYSVMRKVSLADLPYFYICYALKMQDNLYGYRRRNSNRKKRMRGRRTERIVAKEEGTCPHM